MGLEEGHVDDTQVLSQSKKLYLQKNGKRYAKHDIMRVKRHADDKYLCSVVDVERRREKLFWTGHLGVNNCAYFEEGATGTFQISFPLAGTEPILR